MAGDLADVGGRFTTGKRGFGFGLKPNTDSPGPVYNLNSTLGKKTILFTRANRFKTGSSADILLGPGQYEVRRAAGVGKQAPSFGEGREAWSKVLFFTTKYFFSYFLPFFCRRREALRTSSPGRNVSSKQNCCVPS
jgi:hypothetical protein